MQIPFLFLFALSALAGSPKIISPASIPETWSLPSNSTPSTIILPLTDSTTIAKTISIIDQKSGAVGRPNQPVPKTGITAIDGKLVLPSSSAPKSTHDFTLMTRSATDYELVFNGSGLSSIARDAAIQGTAYLTFSLIPNSTYNIDGCLRFCDSVPACTFANLYYEFTNDPSNSDLSNLKCVLYADIHTADEKTYWGNQLSSSPQTYIQHSSGWSVKTVNDPDTPQGYESVFGPTNASNSAYGYMGFVFLERYDVSVCAQECNKRNPNAVSGACQYFNIWRAVVNGTPTTYSCSMYSHTTDVSTATNTGHGSLKVTLSRGYKRINYIIDGSFEIFPPSSSLSSCPYTFFCYLPSSATWTGLSSPTGNLDAAVFLYQPLAHFGIAFGLLGSATLSDPLPGTLTPSSPLHTLPGRNYTIGFFHTSSFSSHESEQGAFVDILWNGKVMRTIKPGWSAWKYYTVDVIGKGQDEIAFHGGSAPAWSFIDDISVYEA